MTNGHSYEYFKQSTPAKVHLAAAEAAGGQEAAPPNPDDLTFTPMEVSPNCWQLPNDSRTFRTEAEAKHQGYAAEYAAKRAYANYVNALPTSSRTPGQELHSEYAAARDRALSEGVTPEAWATSAEIRAAYFIPEKSGYELMQEYRENK